MLLSSARLQDQKENNDADETCGSDDQSPPAERTWRREVSCAERRPGPFIRLFDLFGRDDCGHVRLRATRRARRIFRGFIHAAALAPDPLRFHCGGVGLAVLSAGRCPGGTTPRRFRYSSRALTASSWVIGAFFALSGGPRRDGRSVAPPSGLGAGGGSDFILCRHASSRSVCSASLKESFPALSNATFQTRTQGRA